MLEPNASYQGVASQKQFWRGFWIAFGAGWLVAAITVWPLLRLVDSLPSGTSIDAFENIVGTFGLAAIAHLLLPIGARRANDAGRNSKLFWIGSRLNLIALSLAIFSLLTLLTSWTLGFHILSYASSLALAFPAILIFYSVYLGFVVTSETTNQNQYGPNPTSERSVT